MSFYGLVLVLIPPQTSDQLKLLDLGLFALHKMECHHVHPHTDLRAQTDKIQRVPFVNEFVKSYCNISFLHSSETRVKRFEENENWKSEPFGQF
jgi:hypothetical protein